MYHKHFKVKQEVNSGFKFEDVNVDVRLSFLELSYGTWLVEIAKEINRVLLKNAKFK